MSRFGELLGGETPAPAPAAPAKPDPVVVPSKPVEAIAPEPIQGIDESLDSEDGSYSTQTILESVDNAKPITISVANPFVNLDVMSKKELEEYGRTVGIELDRRRSRKRLVKELKEHLTNS